MLCRPSVFINWLVRCPRTWTGIPVSDGSKRFFAKYVLDLDIIARIIFSLLPVKTGLVLSMDRTNWKFGEFNINILMLGITYKGIAFPLIFSLLPKRGNSNWEERRKIMERFIRLFGSDCIDCLVADREFIGKEWTG